METKDELIKSTIHQLLKVAKKYARIEELPIALPDGTEVTTREAHVIQAIGEEKDLNITSLASHFGISKSAASQMVAKLVKKGYIEKKRAPLSDKEYLLSLTQLGWEIFDAHELFHGGDMAELVGRLEAFSLNQVATISVILETIGAVVDERLSVAGKE